MKHGITEYERAAQRRIGYVSPLTAGKVLGHARYWTLPFLRLYLDLCDETAFHHPEEGYLLGQHAPELARRIPYGEHGYASKIERQSWRAHALAVWGSCCRICGELTQAESAYRLALELTERRELSEDCRGEVHVRLGVLRMVQGQQEAVDEVSRAIEFFSAAENQQRVADCLSIRGLARYLARDPKRLADLARALELTDGKSARGRRTLTTILHNMALVISRGGVDVAAQEMAYRLLMVVKRRLPRNRSVQKAKITWVEGLLLARLGITRLAERRLQRARKSFKQNQKAFELAAVSLDLVCFYLEEGDLGAAERLAVETHFLVLDLTEDTQLREAAEAWRGHITVDGSKAFQELFWRECFDRRARPEGLF